MYLPTTLCDVINSDAVMKLLGSWTQSLMLAVSMVTQTFLHVVDLLNVSMDETARNWANSQNTVTRSSVNCHENQRFVAVFVARWNKKNAKFWHWQHTEWYLQSYNIKMKSGMLAYETNICLQPNICSLHEECICCKAWHWLN